MSRQYQTRRLLISDAEIVEECFNSQPRLMLRDKTNDESAYAGVFRSHLLTGCVSYGAFSGEELRAFCTVWQWSGFPIGSLVLFVNKPDGSLFNPERTGLACAVDAALDHLAAIGVPTVYFVRAESTKWRNSRITKNFGLFGLSFSKDVERIKSGQLSKHEAINTFVLNNQPPKADAILVCVTRPPLGDF